MKVRIADSIVEAREQGLATYLSHTPCPKGHVGRRRTINGECAKCASIRALNSRKRRSFARGK